MATDLDKLIVQLSADIKGYERAMTRAAGIMNKQAREIERRAQSMNKKLDGIGRRAATSFIAPLAGISAALSFREVMRYADAWTVAQNKINAASQIAGLQGRSLEDLNKIADETRSGISETVDLYAKLLRSTAGVAKNEMEVARATEVVNKVFKAGGAAASEQAAGILQLSQGLGSGLLQGDELRSVRENAPILAQAIADYYQVSIAGLKKLGEEGKITSEGVFRAILAAQPKIEAAFSTTNATIQDGVTRVNNAFTQYIGQTDSSLSASQRLVAGLTSLADNFDQVADVTLKVAGVLSAGLLGRSIAGMVAKLGLGAVALTRFVAAARAATSITGLSTAFLGLAGAAGPIGMLIGATAATAMVLYAEKTRQAAEKTENLRKEMSALGLYVRPVAASFEAAAKSLDDLTNRERIRRIRDLRIEMEAVRGNGGLSARLFGNSGELGDILDRARRGVGLKAGWVGGSEFEAVDRPALESVRELGLALRDNKASADDVFAAAKRIETVDLSKPARQLVADLIDISGLLAGANLNLEALGGSADLEEATAQLEKLRGNLEAMRNSGHWDSAIVEGIERIIERFDAGETSAEEAQKAIAEVGNANPDFGGIIGRISTVIGWLATLRAAAISAKEGIATIGGDPKAVADSYKWYGESRRRGELIEADNAAYMAEQRRRNSLSKENLAIEDEVNRILKDRPELLRSQAQILARETIAAQAGRRAGGGGKALERFDDQILKEIEGMKAETVALDGLTSAQIGYGNAVARAKKEAEILQDLQNKGLKVTPELRARVSELADEWQKAAQANQEANKRLEGMEAISQTVGDALRNAFDGAFDDPKRALEDLGKQFAMLALKMQLMRLFPSVFGASGIVPLMAASGGYIRGPGTGTSDSIPARLSDGEFVVNAAATAKNRSLLEAINSGRAMAMARGGYVGAPAMPSMPRTGGAAAAPVINIRNEGPAVDVTRTEQRRGPDGRQMFDIYLNEAITRGKTDKSMKAAFGSSRQKVVR